MITLVADRPSDLLAIRFATSPVWETAHAVRTYAHKQHSTFQRPWQQAVAAAAAELDLAALLAVNPRSGYVPDFLTPPPEGPAPRLARQLAEVRRTPPAQVEQELARCLAGVTDPVDRSGLERLLSDPVAARDTLADQVEQAWRSLVAPYWPRIRALLGADVAYRSRVLAGRGLRRVFDDLDDRIRWSGTSLAVDVPGDEQVVLDERGLVLMPSAYIWPAVSVVTDEPWQPTVIYPARGIGELWQSPRRPAAALERLLGGTRATILASLDTPTSTTDLAARLGLSPSGVSRHLLALRDAGLLTTTRHGHELRYGRTRLGRALAGAPDRVT